MALCGAFAKFSHAKKVSCASFLVKLNCRCTALQVAFPCQANHKTKLQLLIFALQCGIMHKRAFAQALQKATYLTHKEAQNENCIDCTRQKEGRNHPTCKKLQRNTFSPRIVCNGHNRHAHHGRNGFAHSTHEKWPTWWRPTNWRNACQRRFGFDNFSSRPTHGATARTGRFGVASPLRRAKNSTCNQRQQCNHHVGSTQIRNVLSIVGILAERFVETANCYPVWVAQNASHHVDKHYYTKRSNRKFG